MVYITFLFTVKFVFLSVEIKELSKLKAIKQCQQLINQKLNSSGTEWTLDVQCVQFEQKQQANETSNFIKANLYSDIGQRIKLIGIRILIIKLLLINDFFKQF